MVHSFYILTLQLSRMFFFSSSIHGGKSLEIIQLDNFLYDEKLFVVQTFSHFFLQSHSIYAWKYLILSSQLVQSQSLFFVSIVRQHTFPIQTRCSQALTPRCSHTSLTSIHSTGRNLHSLECDSASSLRTINGI